MIRILFIVCFLSFTSLSQAQIRVSVVLDSAKVLIGDQVGLHLQVNAPPSANIRFPILDNPGGLEVLKLGPVDTLARSPELILKQDATVSAYDSGIYVLPSLDFAYGFEADNYLDTVQSRPVQLIVNVMALDSMDIRPIKPILKERAKLSDYIWYIITPIALFLLLGLIALIGKFRKKKHDEGTLEEPKEPSHIIAFRKLAALKEQKLWQKGEIKAYQSELSYILREYLENRYEILALESTTPELVGLMKTQEIESEWQHRLSEVFQTADFVKFAKSTPAEEVHDRFMKYAERFVEETQYVEPDPEPETEESPEE